MQIRWERTERGLVVSHSVSQSGTPSAPTNDTPVLIAVLGTKAVYQVSPGLLPPGRR
jgi:hypothetical protein